MIYLIEPNKDSNGHFTIYLKSEFTLKSRLPDHYLLTQHYLSLY